MAWSREWSFSFQFENNSLILFCFKGVLSFPAFATHDEFLYRATKDVIVNNLVINFIKRIVYPQYLFKNQ
jgi:hypothetical protein